MESIRNRINSNPFYKEIMTAINLLGNDELSKIYVENDFYKINLQRPDRYPISLWLGLNKNDNKLFLMLGEVFSLFHYEDIEDLEMSKWIAEHLKKILKSNIKEQISIVDSKVQKKSIEVIYKNEIIEKCSYKYFASFFSKKIIENKQYQPWLD